MPQLDNLGLKENPFKNNTDQRYFYADQNRAWMLESIKHLIEHSSNMQVIVGAPGVGKSHLLETLANRIDNNWRVVKINNAQQYDTLSLIEAILNELVAISDDKMELLESLETQLAEIIQSGFKPVLFIDDAQDLSMDCLRFLTQLSQQKQDEEPYINIVLFATIEITERLQGPELKDFRDILHISTLESFDKEGVSGYLRHKMAVAGFDRESPFTPRIVDSIYSNSDGIPEKINFFAGKFLASSGKGDNYITSSSNYHETNIDSQINGLQSTQEEGFIRDLKDDELGEHKTDKAEEQINLLSEKFEEIERMGEQSIDTFFAEAEETEVEKVDQEYTDNEAVLFDDQKFDNQSSREYDDEDSNTSGPAKFIKPIALIAIILTAVLVINNLFDNKPSANSTIELLPLELPEKSLQPEKSPQPVESPQPESNIITDTAVDNSSAEITAPITVPIELPESKTANELEVIEINDSQAKTEQTESAAEIVTLETISSIAQTPVPELRSVEPEPVIGSNSRQFITISGTNLSDDISLVVIWGENKKEFSNKLTPDQWFYENNSKIKLNLSTGIVSQQWQIYAKSVEDRQSKAIYFDVVRPFIADVSIKSISPNPVIGSDTRQTVAITGQGFSRQTVLELEWDKNKKQFSSRLTPDQFEFVSVSQIKLLVATGKKERQWKVSVKNPTSGSTTVVSFSVVSESQKVKTASSQPVPKAQQIKGKNWLEQQPDANFTIQLFGSQNKQAIDQLISKYSLTGDIARFATIRGGQNWYSMTYGNYDSKQAANTAVSALNPKLTNPKPWVRSFSSIKKQLNLAGKQDTVIKSNVPSQSQSGTTQKKDEAWIWTQNPADYTIQLHALSTEKAIQDFINQQKIKSKSVYFKISRNGKPLYVLIYGAYPDKKSAEQASVQLASQIKNSQPWVRSFAKIHDMMTEK